MNQSLPLPPSSTGQKNAGRWVFLAAFLAVASIAAETRAAEEKGPKKTEKQESAEVTASPSDSQEPSKKPTATGQAVAPVLAKLKQHRNDYHKALESMKAADLLDHAVKDPSALKEQRAIVAHFSGVAAQWTQTVENSEPLLRAALENAKIPPSQVEEYFKGFQAGQKRRELQIKLLQQDQAFSTTLLARLDLLEAEWGKWKRQTDGTLVFDQEAAGKRFKELKEKTDEVVAEQNKTREELAQNLKEAKEQRSAPR